MRFAISILAFAILLSGRAQLSGPSDPGTPDLDALTKRRQEAVKRHDYRAVVQANREITAVYEQLGDTLRVARFLMSTGAYLFELQDVPAALNTYRKGLEVATQNGFKYEAAQMWRGLAQSLNWLGQTQEALTAGENSLHIFEELNNQAEIPGALILVANFHAQMGDNKSAAALYHKSLRIAEETKDTATIGRALTNLALLYDEQGDTAVALSFAERRLKDPRLQPMEPRSTARTLNVLASLYGRMGRYPAALAAVERGLAVMSGPNGDPVLKGILLGARGNIRRLQGDYGKALEDYTVYNEICAQRQNPERQTGALESIAWTQILLGRNEDALKSAAEGLALSRQVRSRSMEWRLLNAEGIAYHRLGRLPEAEAALRESIASVESWHSRIAGGEMEGRDFFSFAVTPYQELMAIKVEQNDLPAAFALAENAKARHLLEVLTMGRAQAMQAMTDEEKKREQALAREADRWNAAMTHQRAPDAKIASAFEKASGDLESFRANLFLTHPELKARRGEAEPLTLAEAGDLLPDAQTLLLEFTVSSEAVYVFALERGPSGKPAITARKLAVRPSALKVQVDAYREQLATRDLAYREAAARLYKELLAPIESKLAKRQVVGIVPDGPLWDLPFSTLTGSSGRYLIEDHAVFCAPSLTALRAGARMHHPVPAGRTLLALGPPESDTSQAATEVRELGRLYGTGASVYTGAEATEERWRKEAPKYRILHIATHGLLNGSNPLFSYLQLSADKKEQYGMLEAREILDEDLHAELAVLSACETARGAIRNGEGMIGMSWALMMAGTPSVVVSQWKVDSAGTTQLMLAFHRAIRKGVGSPGPLKGKASALQGAALELLHSSEFRHPFYWSGFQLVGDGF